MCKNRNSSASNFIQDENLSNESEYDYVFNIGGSKVPPIYINMLLNDKDINMELDTGSYYTIMPNNKLNEIWPVSSERPQLEPFDRNLNVYGGSPLKVDGVIKVQAKLKDAPKMVKTEIIIVSDNGPTLLGRALIKDLEISNLNFSTINKLTSKSSWLEEFPELFASGLGCFKGETFSIDVDTSVEPKFFKARPVPYAMKDMVSKELDRLQDEGIISPVTYSAWAAPTLPVLKSNDTVRLCGDYKLTVNLASRLDSYPIPRVQDLFSNLSNCSLFTKLDMSQAYAQLCLDEESKKYTVINTQRGLFRYERLAFGIASAPGIFQRAMENLLKDLPGVICYLDDILIMAKSMSDHDKQVRQVLNRLQSAGLRLKYEKCSFQVTEVTYLGFKVDKHGLNPTAEKVRAIKDAPTPTNISQLRSYLGLFNFYRKFIPKAATLLEPLNHLLRSSNAWKWSTEQEDAFQKSKDALIRSEALVHFDPEKPIVLVTDSSAYGIGAVLCHKIEGKERPVTFASHTLNTAERNYSQLEKEALALVYGLRQFHDYLWGQPVFTLVTDHRPLLGLFGSAKPISHMASGRIQRWALLMQAYRYELIHRSGERLGTADALSRLPLSVATESTPIPADWTNLVNFLDYSPVNSLDISNATRNDKVLSKVRKYLEVGWPAVTKDVDIQPFFRRQSELSLESGCILWGSRVIIPTKLQPTILKELHSSHTGAARMKELGRSYVWWPGLDKTLESLTASYPKCLEK